MFMPYNYSESKAIRYLCLDRESFDLIKDKLHGFTINGLSFYDKRSLEKYRLEILKKYNLIESAIYLKTTISKLRYKIKKGEVAVEKSKAENYRYIYKPELDRLKKLPTKL